MEPSKRTQSPVVTGSSILAIKYKDGAMMMADTAGSYGMLLRFTGLERIRKVNPFTFVGASGEYSDFQYISKLLLELSNVDYEEDDGHVLRPAEINAFLSRVFYNRRSRVNPLYNALIVVGFADGKSYLGYNDMYGSAFEDNYLATGYGGHISLPIIRKQWRPDLTFVQAKQLLDDCMRVLLYRDCLAYNKFVLATASTDGLTLSDPYSLNTFWDYTLFVDPTASLISVPSSQKSVKPTVEDEMKDP